MTIDFLPGDRVKIANDSPYSDEFNGKFATVVPVNYGAVPDWVTVAPDGDPTHKGRLETKYLTYIPKEGDVVRVANPGSWDGEHKVVSDDNDVQVCLQHGVGNGRCWFLHRDVTLVRRAGTEPTWKVGDIVRVKDGPTGVATSIRGRFTTVTHSDDTDTDYLHEAVERVHVLTHEELTAVEAAHLQPSAIASNRKAAEILSAHLRPTVTRTFEVTVVQPGGAPKPVDTAWLQQNVQRHAPNTEITIKEKTS